MKYSFNTESFYSNFWKNKRIVLTLPLLGNYTKFEFLTSVDLLLITYAIIY